MRRSVKPAINIFWFKRDLRVAVNRALSACAADGLPVLPLYMVEPALWRQPDAAHRHYRFIEACLAELRTDLGAVGQPLVVRVGDVPSVLGEIAGQFDIVRLYSHEETGNAWSYDRDKLVKHWCTEQGVEWREFWQTGVVRGLKDRDGWAGRWNRRMHATPPEAPTALTPLPVLDIGPIPTAEELDLVGDGCVSPQTGGRQAGLIALESFLTQRGQNYRTAMSSPMNAFDSCSRLSPYLAYGAVSMQEAAQATARRRLALKQAPAGTGAWRGSLSSFSGRLHWHCHFMQKLEDAPSLEFEELHPAYRGVRPSAPDPARLAAWEKGETGLPFVDACMRCLQATGWMNFRMRAMLVAVASYHLWLDWRATGRHLARLFTDYEPGIHWSQMQMQSGVTGINTVRIYNPVKQGLDQDPTGAFVRRWIPELAAVPDAHMHQPWQWEDAATVLDKAYPTPIVDHLAAAKEARQKIWAVRKGPDYRAEANAIQAKHGSRRSGIKRTGRRAKAASPGSTDQLSLDLGQSAPS
ncbi:MAG: deoxyribodipyrimidine photo-lyase [Alphaproteobacteria bacterium]|nr:deoxyribodipyrimidine photo-lyase [Alphaproteobacteria bacterium]